MLAPVPEKIDRSACSEFEAFDLPYLFPDIEALHKVYNGPVGAAMLKNSRPRIGGSRVLGQRLPGHEREQADSRRRPT
jgi:C4-dicarboxylate-binding protein DctP